MKRLAPLPALLSAALLLAACGQSQPGTSQPGQRLSPAPNTAPASATGSDVLALPLNSPAPQPLSPEAQSAARRLQEGYVPRGPSLHAQALPAGAQTNRVALKVLVLSSGAGDFGLSSAVSMLKESAIPYDVFDASTQPLTMDTLVRGDGVGRYQGVILTSSALLMPSSTPGPLPSALDSAEWATLFEYERAYRVRQLALFGWPGAVPEDYGLRAAGDATTLTTAQATPEGQRALPDLTPRPVQVLHAYTYPAEVVAVSGVSSTTPLLTDPNGRVLAAASTTSDGRERLLLTTMQAPTLPHTQLLGYGLMEWLTRGVHLGEHRRFLQIDIDDWFLPGSHYNAATGGFYPDPFRIGGSDALSLRDQQQTIAADFPVARDFRYALAFNGMGARTDAPLLCTRASLPGSPDPLSSASRCLADSFDWFNHTRDHLRMDVMDEATATTQLADNLLIGAQLGLKLSRSALVTGEQSGLGYMDPSDDGTRNDAAYLQPKQDLGLQRSNVNLLTAMNKTGTRYIASNHSVASQWDAGCPTCGVRHPLNQNVFLVPRWPNGVAYFSTTPDEVTGYYNSVYGPQGTAPHWDHNLSYAELLDQESGFALGHLLDGGAFPHYMHQANLREYAPGQSVASDWVRALLRRYSSVSTLPLTTLRWDDLGPYLERRTRTIQAQDRGDLSGVYDRASNTVTLSSKAPLPYLLTGGAAGTPYGALRLQSGDVSGQLTVNVTPR
ncbi:Agd3-related carbohydrate-binding protein [Deinococcus wulumuqiensis]|uniref:Agd3 CBM87 domain-containing protein n=1 Tax=Deinococcus wulumuqiensis TaxID=980427 RepID=A0AAV4K852_9DEIO|nr:hypothetical protein [Deinococcus wulumuqiensis]QII20791.1 hypothetical protein G6R31_08505 [Deinococcus wulumuqiensis R12]GGI80205.1 hypothetical protein GCM10010914_13010 [Deinococcus wulumuqiensis]GGP29381.1 hypothetical protein GCM10008021_10320 [Deinococcus wulumuqiensis]